MTLAVGGGYEPPLQLLMHTSSPVSGSFLCPKPDNLEKPGNPMTAPSC